MSGLSTTTVLDRARANVAELADLVDHVSDDEVQQALTEITGAERVYFAGIGRSGLSARAIAMRLMHIGLNIHIVGDTTTPAVGAGDLLVVFSSSGSGALHEQALKAQRLGARVLAVTAGENTPLAETAQAVLVVPARTQVPSLQHAGSLFEQGCLVIGDALSAAVRTTLAVEESALDQRHANLP